MFKKEMTEKLKAIFGIPKVSFDDPSDSFEQDCIFVEILDSKNNTGTYTASAKVTGNVVVFSQHEKLPFGFFNKKIQQADPKHTREFFFFDTDVEPQNSKAQMLNISERRTGFVYLYQGQYDPNQGELTSLSFPDEDDV